MKLGGLRQEGKALWILRDEPGSGHEDDPGARVERAGYLAVVVAPGQHFVACGVVRLAIGLPGQCSVGEEQPAVVAMRRYPQPEPIASDEHGQPTRDAIPSGTVEL